MLLPISSTSNGTRKETNKYIYVGLAQDIGPIQLDTEKAQELLRNRLVEEHSSAKSPEAETSASMAQGKQTEGSIPARGVRVRVKPKWLREFVRLESR